MSQNHHSALGQRSNGDPRREMSGEGDVYTDPASLFSVFPPVIYTPTARVAEHIAPHTVVYPSPASSSDLYPQHADMFNMLDDPRSFEDWAARRAAEDQVKALLRNAGPGYVQQAYPIPHYTGSSTWTHPQKQASALPLPYSFLPSYMPSPSSFRDPPTPSSLNTAPSPSTSIAASDYFPDFLDRTLGRTRRRSITPTTVDPSSLHNPSSSATTPTLNRRMAMTVLTPSESPDPLAFSRPSPTKRRKSHALEPVSPTLQASRNLPASRAHVSQNGEPKQNGFPSSNTPSPTKQKQLVVEVEVPVKSKTSGSPDMQISLDGDESDEDELDWGENAKADCDGNWKMDTRSFRSPSPGVFRRSMVPQGSGRTGERDRRTHFQKLQSLFEDIFEESDSFPANPTAGDAGSSKYFSGTSNDGDHPLLASATIEKITRYVSRAQGSKRRSASDTEGLEGDVGTMRRVLKLLERSMRQAERVEVFPEDRKPSSSVKDEKNAGTGKGRKKGGKKSKSPVETQDSKQTGTPEISDIGLDEARIELLEEALSALQNRALAAECCLVLLDSGRVSKQLFSEDLLSTCVTAVKDSLTKVIFPVIEGLASDRIESKLLAHVVHAESASAHKGKSPKKHSPFFKNPALSEISQTCCTTVPRLTSLINKPDMAFSDSLVIQAVYLAIGPLFINEPSTKKGRGKEGNASGRHAGLSVLKSLRMEALGCLRAIFVRYDHQRQWIIEEILSSLVKMSSGNNAQTRFQLLNGTSISTMSALLLQLIQASNCCVTARVRKLRSSIVEMETSAPKADRLDIAEEEARICAEMTESALRSARVVAGYLVQRSTSTKASKTSRDADYKAILDVFVSDLLCVLYRPEWPAASLYLSVLSRLVMSPLEDPKPGAEASAVRNIALDYLGDIAARLRSFHPEMQGEGSVPSLDEIISSADVDGASSLIASHANVQAFLSTAARDDGMFACSLDMASVIWAQELQGSIQKAASVMEKSAGEKGDDAEENRQRLQHIVQQFRSALHKVWMGDDVLFEISDPKQAENAVQASIAVARGRSLQAAFEPILHALVGLMDTPVVALRSKALRGIGNIVTVDPDVLGMPAVRQAIEDRLSDSSPAVRDAAVELVGKYVVKKPSLAAEYYPHIALRVTDSGLGVRKRVIKLLSGIFFTSKDPQIRVDICCNLVTLVLDQDDSVNDLASKTLADMLYPAEPTRMAKSSPAALLVEIIGEYKGSNAALEAALQAVAKESAGTGRTDRSAETVDTLMGLLIDGTEQADFDSLSHIRAIYLLCAGQPSLIDTNKAAILLTYLHPATTSDQHASNEFLLRILRRCIPKMPRAASTFASDLQNALMPMIRKPSGGFQTIKEVVGCYCAVVDHLTRDYKPLIQLLKACAGNIRTMKPTLIEETNLQIQMQAGMTMYISALIVEHCNLDAVAEDDTGIRQELSKIGDLPISEYFYDMFLDFSRMPLPQASPTTCLGCLFRAYPALVLTDKASEWMGRVFASKDMDNRARVLGVIHEFLASEVERKASGAKHQRDMQSLIGGTTEMSESGISTAVIQRNIQHILDGAISQHPATQSTALDVLSFSVNQGLSHPLQCLPVIISLETCEDPAIIDRALALHYTLHTKHSTLVNVRFLEFTKDSYEYQRTITSEVSGHRNGTALLAAWYGLISKQRAWRHDFIRALRRAFDYDLGGKLVPDVGFVLYLADNLSTLDYKLQEEPMTVIQQLSSVVSTCTQLASILETASVEGHSTNPLDDAAITLDEGGTEVKARILIHATIIVGLAMLTKNHLLDLYGLAEDKCLKHVSGKKSALGDKPAVRKPHAAVILNIDRMPLVRGVSTVGDFGEQQSTFLQMLQEDGSFGDIDM